MKYEGKIVNYKMLKEFKTPLILNSKELVTYQEKKKWKPSKKHQWKKSKSVA